MFVTLLFSAKWHDRHRELSRKSHFGADVQHQNGKLQNKYWKNPKILFSACHLAATTSFLDPQRLALEGTLCPLKILVCIEFSQF